MDDMYRRGYGRGPMYYPPQQVDPSIVSFGQVQLYDPEHYDRIGAAIMDSQARYDASQAAIAQHISDVGAADIEERHRNEYMAQMHEGLEKLYSGIMKDYDGDVGRASARIIQNLSSDRGLMTQLVQDTAQERQARAEYQQLAASGNVPHTIDASGVRRVLSFEEYHNLGRFDSEGNFRRGEFNPLRGAADISGYLERHVSKALNDMQTYGDLKHYGEHGVEGMLRHMTYKGTSPTAVEEYIRKNGNEIAQQLLNEVPNLSEELQGLDKKEAIEAIKSYMTPIIKGQVSHQVQQQFIQNPAFDKKGDKSSPETPIIPTYNKPVEISKEDEKELKALNKLIDKTSELGFEEEILEHIQTLNSELITLGEDPLLYDKELIKFKTDMELFTEALFPGITTPTFLESFTDSEFNTNLVYEGVDKMFEEARDRYNKGEANAEDVLLLSEYSKYTASGKSLLDKWIDYDKRISAEYLTSGSERTKKRIDIGGHVIRFMTGENPIVEVDVNKRDFFEFKKTHATSTYNKDIFEPGSHEYIMRSNLLKIISEGKGNINVGAGLNIIKDSDGYYTFEAPTNMTLEQANRKLLDASMTSAKLITNKLMTKPKKRQERIDKLTKEIKKEVGNRPVADIYLAEEMLKGMPLDKAAANVLTTLRNTVRDESAKVHFIAPFRALAESAGARKSQDGENRGWVEELILKAGEKGEKKDKYNNKYSTIQNAINLKDSRLLYADFNVNDFTLDVAYTTGTGANEVKYSLNIEDLVDTKSLPMIRYIKDFTKAVANMDYIKVDVEGNKTIEPIEFRLGDRGIVSVLETVPDKLNKGESMYKPTLYAVEYDEEGELVSKSLYMQYGTEPMEVGAAMRQIFANEVFEGLAPFARESRKLKK